jgi:glyoxylase-like metal-dependent hydrolase (beta-lactamase superfamily II)
MGFEMKRLVVGPLEANCYLLWDKADRSAVVVDPGDDGDYIKEEVEREGLDVKYIVNTHGHFDHIGANKRLRDSLGARLAIHASDVPLVEGATFQGSHFGIETPAQPPPEILLADGTELEAGGLSLTVLHTPGHTEGSVCLYLEKEGVLFTGDTLFAGGVGRTDLPGGSHRALMKSIREKILPLGDTVRVFPGHGPETTIGQEKGSNPFIMDDSG